MDTISTTTKTFDNDLTMSDLFTSDSLSDVKFVFDEGAKQIAAHKLILATKSSLFRRMFYDENEYEFLGNIQITDASPEEFTEFLQIFYLDKVTLTGNNVAKVMDLADTYDVPQCTAVCIQFLKEILCSDNMLWIYEMSERYDCKDLKSYCADKIQIDPKSIFDTPSFKECERNLLMFILSINLNCDELTVFNACMDWAKYACERENIVQSTENYKKVLGNCFHLIRFPAMTNKELCTVLQSDIGFFDMETLADIFMHINLDQPLKVATQFNGECRQKELNLIRYHSDSKACNHTIQEQEVIKFSTNKRIMLKGIIINETIHDLISCILVGNIKILNDDVSADDLLLEQSIRVTHKNDNYYNFIKPIIIHPHQRHMIKITFKKNVHKAFPVQVKQYDEIVLLNEGIEFKFEASLDESYDFVHYGLISGFRFDPMFNVNFNF